MRYVKSLLLGDGNCTAVFVQEEDTEIITDCLTGEVIELGTEFIETKRGYVAVARVEENPRDFAICECCGEALYLPNEEHCQTENHCVVCGDCFYSEEYFICEHCGLAVPEDRAVEIHTDGWHWRDNPFFVCDDCADSNYYRCDHCGWYYENNDFYATRYGTEICERCFEDNYHECCECGEIVSCEDGSYDDNDDWCCDECYGSRNIHSYHSHCRNDLDRYNINGKLDWEGIGLPENKLLSGVELEVENSRTDSMDRNKMAGEIIEMMDNRIYCECDGSLTDGFEIIFKPHTPDAFRALPLREMLDKLRSEGYTSHDNGDCGLHIHVSNEWFGDTYEEQDDNASKVVHLYSEQYDFFLACSRRTEQQANCWASKVACKDFEDAKMKKHWSTGHGVAVNLQNMSTFGTVEFRLGRGTLNYDSFMAWYDMHLAIARNAKNIEPNDLDLNKWLAGITDETKDYILARTGKVVA